MFDNHTFRDLGTDLEAAIESAKACFDEDPYGSLFARDEGQREPACAHGHGRERKAEFLTSLTKFREAIHAAHSYSI